MINRRTPQLIAIFACGSVFSLTQGLLYPYFSQRLMQLGYTPTVIGLSAAITPAGMWIGALLTPKILQRFSAGATVILCSFLVTFCLFSIAVLSLPELWHFIRFFVGFGVAVIFVTVDTTLAKVVDKSALGKIFGVYATITSCGFAAGPLILTLQSDIYPVILVGFFISTAAVFFFSQHNALILVPEKNHARTFHRGLTIIVIGTLAASVAEQSIMTIGPIILSIRFSTAEIGFLLATLGAGSVVLQPAMGWIVDRYGTLVISGALCISCAVVAQFIRGDLPILQVGVSMFFFGGLSYGLFTVMMIHAARSFKGGQLVGANVVLTLSWSLGGILGPSLIGFMGDKIGTDRIVDIYTVMFLIITPVFIVKLTSNRLSVKD